MNARRALRPLAAAAVAAPFLLLALPAAAGTVDPALQKAISGMKPGEEVAVVVALADRVPVSAYAPQGVGRKDSASALVQALRAKAAATQPAVVAAALSIGGRLPVSLWAINALALRLPHELVTPLSAIPGVDTVRLDAVIDVPTSPKVPAPASAVSASPNATTTPEWNVQMLHAPDLWAAGSDGTGAVVATLDTGADSAHPDLGPRWRGGTNSWYDPNGQHSTPYDASGHGTQVLGLLLGGSSGGTAIGVAPGAKWIAAKIFNDQGQATLSGIHQAFQWLLDPDGNPGTADAPDVVNSSWTYPSTVGTCWTEFANDISVLRAAGIEVVFSAGNDGGASGTSESPANNAGAFPVGAVDSSRTIAPFSSRGPSACGGSTWPKTVAGGVSVKSADLTFGGVVPNSYAIVSGTSFSAPQVAGAFALLAAAHPSASLPTLEGALLSTAVDLGVAGPDNDYGAGLPDVMSASSAIGSLPPPPTAQADAWSVAAGTTLTVAAPGVLANDSSPSGAPLSAALGSGPSAGTLALAADGSFTYAAPAAAGTYTFTYTATDGTQWSAPATVTITVTGGTQPPTANADAFTTTAGAKLSVAAPGVLSNDSSPSGAPLSAVLSMAPSAGTVALASDGSFTYSAPATAGAYTFTYVASDGSQSSAPATVTLTVNPAPPPPVANADGYSTTAGTSLSVAAPGVLANDSSPSGAPLTVVLVSGPSKAVAGSFSLASNGSFTYSTNVLTASTDSFTYAASDGTRQSPAATVTITIVAHPAPVARNDSYSVAPNSTATRFAVLANDSATNAALDPSSVRIGRKPNHRGSVTANADGTISYTPSRFFRGTENFTYSVKDSLGATSAAATVTVIVN